MRSSQYFGIFTILILGLAVLISPIALSYLVKTITINSTGRVLATKPLITQVSEIRGVFIHEATYGVSHNWTLIAQTLAKYGINAVFVNDMSGGGFRPYNEIRSAINAFHTYGIQYHSVICVLSEFRHSGTECIKYDGSIFDDWWHCPIKAHDLVLNTIRNYLGNFSDVDGIMLDYIRYDVASVCYCPSCRTAFQEWLGENITDWTPFYPGGSRQNEFLNWRTLPITQLVKDIHDLVKSINPNIVISVAAWSLFDDTGMYWRFWIGQDTAAWIKEGYLDFVAPMMYSKNITGSSDTLDYCVYACKKYWMANVSEGPIPLVAFLRTEWTSSDLTPQQFKEQVDYVRSHGLDGWIIWRYSGPGGYLSGAEYDTDDYLAVLDMPSTFAVANIVVETTANSAVISWLTTSPATSKVEYSTSPLFSASWAVQRGFNYWNIVYTQGIIVEDYANVTIHSIRLENLTSGTSYYFRVQSKGVSGTVTSKVLTFTTK
ncbi:MAG: family 10 glycosylhydrolase [Candidatus Bathyarchaeia archaeon]